MYLVCCVWCIVCCVLDAVCSMLWMVCCMFNIPNRLYVVCSMLWTVYGVLCVLCHLQWLVGNLPTERESCSDHHSLCLEALHGLYPLGTPGLGRVVLGWTCAALSVETFIYLTTSPPSSSVTNYKRINWKWENCPMIRQARTQHRRWQAWALASS